MRRAFRAGESEILRIWLPLGFLTLLTILVALGYGSFANTQSIIEHTYWSRHTVEVQRTIEEVLEALQGAESSQRGFLLTFREDFATQCKEQSDVATEAAKELIGHVADSKGQSDLALELQSFVGKRIGRMNAVIDQARRTHKVPTSNQVTALGPFYMARAQTIAKTMLATEDNLLKERDNRRDASIRGATSTFLISGLVTLCIVTSLYAILRRFLSEQITARLESETHRQALEAEIFEKERAERELQRSNRELQDFAFVASHDLQEPLRKIQAFGDRLRSKNQGVLDEASLDYLARMQSAASRMQELINALLNLSRITTKAQPFAPVSLDAVLAVVVDDLQPRIEDTGGTIVVKKLQTLDADRVQMRQLFQNLIGNALKFRAEGRPIRVEVREGRSENPAVVRIEVSDNGIGFEERHADKIFTIFQRLHGRGEYEGSGIGLAVCRRIVDRHGGNIYATSVPGEGATFIIELPKKQAEVTS